MISYSYHVCIKIKFIPPLCLSLTSGVGWGTVDYCLSSVGYMFHF